MCVSRGQNYGTSFLHHFSITESFVNARRWSEGIVADNLRHRIKKETVSGREVERIASIDTGTSRVPLPRIHSTPSDAFRTLIVLYVNSVSI